MTSNRGIFRVARRSLEGFFDGTASSVESELFGIADGMRSPSCSGGQQPSGWKAGDGRLFFPTFKGIVIVDPKNIARNDVPPPVVVESLVAARRTYSTEKTVSIPPGGGTVELYYTANSFLMPEKVRFRYRLVGNDSDWVEAGGRRVAIYNNLPPGPYSFHVVASNNDGLWNESAAVFSFELRPFFYQTLWFYSILAAAFSASAVWAYRLRLRNLRRRERELIETVEDRTRSLRRRRGGRNERSAKPSLPARMPNASARLPRPKVKRPRTQIVPRASFLRHESRTSHSAERDHRLLRDARGGLGGMGSARFRGRLEEDPHRSAPSTRTGECRTRSVENRGGPDGTSIREFEIVPLLHDVAGIIGPLLEKNSNRVELHVNGDSGTMTSDEMKVRQALFNVMSNACKFTHNGVVALDVKRTTGLGQEQIVFKGSGHRDRHPERAHVGAVPALFPGRCLNDAPVWRYWAGSRDHPSVLPDDGETSRWKANRERAPLSP